MHSYEGLNFLFNSSSISILFNEKKHGVFALGNRTTTETSTTGMSRRIAFVVSM